MLKTQPPRPTVQFFSTNHATLNHTASFFSANTTTISQLVQLLTKKPLSIPKTGKDKTTAHKEANNRVNFNTAGEDQAHHSFSSYWHNCDASTTNQPETQETQQSPPNAQLFRQKNDTSNHITPIFQLIPHQLIKFSAKGTFSTSKKTRRKRL